jgi:hypothetical protein
MSTYIDIYTPKFEWIKSPNSRGKIFTLKKYKNNENKNSISLPSKSNGHQYTLTHYQ